MARPRRVVAYSWQLRQVMAQAGMFATTDLIEPLAQRGVRLSSSQVHRLVTESPRRLNLSVLAALCDMFGCSPDELIVVTADDIPPLTLVT